MSVIYDVSDSKYEAHKAVGSLNISNSNLIKSKKKPCRARRRGERSKTGLKNVLQGGRTRVRV